MRGPSMSVTSDGDVGTALMLFVMFGSVYPVPAYPNTIGKAKARTPRRQTPLPPHGSGTA